MLHSGIDTRQSSLDKFVLIAWCGEGVPESRKGLFREPQRPRRRQDADHPKDTQSSQVSSKFLTGAHLIIQARSEVSDLRFSIQLELTSLQLDVTPAHIHKRIQESSGSKYSSSAAAPAAAAPPAARATPSYRPSQGLGGSQGKVRGPAIHAPAVVRADTLACQCIDARFYLLSTHACSARGPGSATSGALAPSGSRAGTRPAACASTSSTARDQCLDPGAGRYSQACARGPDRSRRYRLRARQAEPGQTR